MDCRFNLMYHPTSPKPVDKTEAMSTAIKQGVRIKVRDGVSAPDLADFSIGGWTGTVVEVKGRADKKRFFVEWDEQTIAQMSAEYLETCESQQLYHLMSCLTADDLEPAS